MPDIKEAYRVYVRGPYTLLPDGRIDCFFMDPGTREYLPYTADGRDPELVGRAVHAICRENMLAGR